jgi:hypothetical protein
MTVLFDQALLRWVVGRPMPGAELSENHLSPIRVSGRTRPGARDTRDAATILLEGEVNRLEE